MKNSAFKTVQTISKDHFIVWHKNNLRIWKATLCTWFCRKLPSWWWSVGGIWRIQTWQRQLPTGCYLSEITSIQSITIISILQLLTFSCLCSYPHNPPNTFCRFVRRRKSLSFNIIVVIFLNWWDNRATKIVNAIILLKDIKPPKIVNLDSLQQLTINS